MIQFFDTMRQIVDSDSVDSFDGARRHLAWQVRKLLNRFPVELNLAGSRLRVMRPCGVAALVNAMGEYDFNNMNFLRSVLKYTRGQFLDVGANIGSYTLIASEIRETTIISIEPHPVTFQWLQENVRLNSRDNVTCLNLAISNIDGEVKFTDGEDPSINRVVHAGEGGTRCLKVRSKRLETLCSEMRIIPACLKVDVEGHEHEVLEGFGAFQPMPKVIIIEHGEDAGVREWMGRAGFAGPFFAHARAQLLSHVRQRRPEDVLYVLAEFLPSVEDCGYKVAE
jgi:FkbM family methyltransferase